MINFDGYGDRHGDGDSTYKQAFMTITVTRTYGVFTLADTDTNTNTDKMGGVGVSDCVCVGQYEHLHTILYNPFFIGVGVGQCEHSINPVVDRL